MNRTSSFTPDWPCPAPFESIKKALSAKQLTPRVFCVRSGIEAGLFDEVMNGSRAIDRHVAKVLEEHVGSTASFWLERERQYRLSLQKRVEEPIESYLARVVPIKEVLQLGWVERPAYPRAITSAIVDFFDVQSKEQYQRHYEDMIPAIAFRRSTKFPLMTGAFAAWMRYAERAAELGDRTPLNRQLLQQSLPSMRQLTREKSPVEFLPKLKNILASAGVSLVVAKPPSGCPVSGAARVLEDGRALILMSLRYKTDDHFWFTLFHEVGHLILHSDVETHVELNESLPSTTEQEANEFAATTLIPHEEQLMLASNIKSKFQIVRMARRIGVSPGIVVGQMQHKALLRRNQFNFLKQKFSWETIL